MRPIYSFPFGGVLGSVSKLLFSFQSLRYLDDGNGVCLVLLDKTFADPVFLRDLGLVEFLEFVSCPFRRRKRGFSGLVLRGSRFVGVTPDGGT